MKKSHPIRPLFRQISRGSFYRLLFLCPGVAALLYLSARSRGTLPYTE